MPGYRSYIVGNDGHFISSNHIFAADEEDAIAIAESLVGINDVEVWCLSRRIALIAGKRGLKPSAAVRLA
jgi:hypothetical protein